MKPSPKPFAFIAHRDGYWAEAMAAIPAMDRHLSDFVAENLRLGCSITTVFSDDEFRDVFGALRPWPERSETEPAQ